MAKTKAEKGTPNGCAIFVVVVSIMAILITSIVIALLIAGYITVTALPMTLLS